MALENKASKASTIGDGYRGSRHIRPHRKEWRSLQIPRSPKEILRLVHHIPNSLVGRLNRKGTYGKEAYWQGCTCYGRFARYWSSYSTGAGGGRCGCSHQLRSGRR